MVWIEWICAFPKEAINYFDGLRNHITPYVHSNELCLGFYFVEAVLIPYFRVWNDPLFFCFRSVNGGENECRNRKSD